MRTTITIHEDLLKKTQQLTGLSGYSEAIVHGLQDYITLKEKIDFLEDLFRKKAPHSYKKIKSARKKNKWS
ncbi:MAG: type II toxin-antitoxin system VapB family antitoxin [Deltaproteobacteria bacterium]|nr:type II toxin-antitoxin system VapB family antitoxin [Deltaproteobacteria bacterium]